MQELPELLRSSPLKLAELLWGKGSEMAQLFRSELLEKANVLRGELKEPNHLGQRTNHWRDHSPGVGIVFRFHHEPSPVVTVHAPPLSAHHVVGSRLHEGVEDPQSLS